MPRSGPWLSSEASSSLRPGPWPSSGASPSPQSDPPTSCACVLLNRLEMIRRGGGTVRICVLCYISFLCSLCVIMSSHLLMSTCHFLVNHTHLSVVCNHSCSQLLILFSSSVCIYSIHVLQILTCSLFGLNLSLIVSCCSPCRFGFLMFCCHVRFCFCLINIFVFTHCPRLDLGSFLHSS